MQSSDHIFLVRPASFGFNSETADSNAFQKQSGENYSEIQKKVFSEFDAMVRLLKEKEIDVTIIEDTLNPAKPDAIFPNNWISLHENGTIFLYPMFAPNRRLERRLDILESLKKSFQVKEVIDLSHYESENKFLEGTGSMVLDHEHKIAYACISPRTDKDLFNKCCSMIGYKPIAFYSHDKNGKEIYHTNVVMCIGTGFAVVCVESITKPEEKQMVLDSLKGSGLEIIDISLDQMNNFAGNMLEVRNKNDERYVALSRSAFNALDAKLKEQISVQSKLLPISIPTIESTGGGSVRCMMAEIFLPPKTK